jgi:hypothetical protein
MYCNKFCFHIYTDVIDSAPPWRKRDNNLQMRGEPRMRAKSRDSRGDLWGGHHVRWEQESFEDAVRIYYTKERVNAYNHDHMLGLNSPALDVIASHQGIGAEKASSQDAGNLSKSFPVCVGCRVMLTRNVWTEVGLFNGAQGTVYDIGWASGADPLREPPVVIMVAFDKYDGPPYVVDGSELRDMKGRLVVPILRVQQDFNLKGNTCSRMQFPLVVSYAITVHKSQSVTLSQVVCDISAAEFASGLAYVAVSRASKLEGLMFDAPFDRSRVYRDPPTRAMQMKIDDYETRRQRQQLTRPLYNPLSDHSSAGDDVESDNDVESDDEVESDDDGESGA